MAHLLFPPGARRRPPRRLARAGLLVLVASGTLAQPAAAGPLVADAPDCAPQSLTKPFAPWFDVANYAFVPNGGFEQGAVDWQLDGAAAPVDGNEPFAVRDKADRASLSLPAGSRATTRTVCVGLGEPTLRFFARRTDGLRSVLKIEVLFEDGGGAVHALPIGVDAGGPWHPTIVMPIVVNLLPLLPGEKTPVAFRFTPVGDGDWQIDDVYYDPWVMR